jgi:hypothetical protein
MLPHLPEDDRRLLTGSVDGELSKAQWEEVQRLIRESQEAQALLRQLEEDSQKLQSLPRKQLGTDLAPLVVKRITRLELPSQRTRTFPTWLGVVAAASVLVAVGTASFLFFHALVPRDQQDAVVHDGEAQGLRLVLKDLAHEHAQLRLAQELKKDKAFHLDVPCSNSALAVAELGKAFAHKGIKLLVDPQARTSLENTPLATEILVYAENIQPDELADILNRMSTAENGQFDTVLLNPMSREDLKHLSRLLGVKNHIDPKLFENRIIESKDRKTKGSGAEKHEDKTGRGRFAVVLANAAHTPTRSFEILEFLGSQSRNEQRPGTVQVMLILRPRNA